MTKHSSTFAFDAELLTDNPFNALNLGCDFLRNHTPPSVDFATIHLWPDTWLPGKSDDEMLRFARRWINCHVDCCSSSLGKPLVVSEFGKKPGGIPRAAFYEKVRIPSLNRSSGRFRGLQHYVAMCAICLRPSPAV